MEDTAHLTRQLEILPIEVLGESITIIGSGAIGSFVALTLAKMGFQDITVYDFDTVKIENINAQFFRFCDIGKPKVEALKEIVKDFTRVEIEAKNERYESGAFNGIVIMAVDSMVARTLIWNNHKDFAVGTKLIIDGRMASEEAMILAMNPTDDKDVASYEKTLYSDEEAVFERCTRKAIIYSVLGIASHIAKIVKDFLTTENHNYSRMCQWSFKHNRQKLWMKIV